MDRRSFLYSLFVAPLLRALPRRRGLVVTSNADSCMLTNQQASEIFASYMDSLVRQSAGDNMLDTVVALTAPNGLQVNNANIFQDNQQLDMYDAQSGNFVQTIEVLSVDIANNTIWLTNAYPAATAAGYALYVQGSAAVANSGLSCLPYYCVGDARNFTGISRRAH